MQGIDRRSLLRLFGIGATVVPVVKGFANMDAEARLIVEPKVELVRPVAPLRHFATLADMQGFNDMQVSFRNPSGTYTFEARVFNLSLEQESIRFATHDMPQVVHVPTIRRDIQYTLKGELIHYSAPERS